MPDKIYGSHCASNNMRTDLFTTFINAFIRKTNYSQMYTNVNTDFSIFECY